VKKEKLIQIKLLERKLLATKAIYLKEEHEPITSVLKYLEEIINKIDEYLPGNPQVATLLIDELTKFHESLKDMRVLTKSH
jgi:hypothetical protein